MHVFHYGAFPLLQCYRDLALVSRDGMNIVLNKINQILMEKYLKLQDTCRTQVRGAASLAEGEEGALEPGRGGSWAHLEGTERGGGWHCIHSAAMGEPTRPTFLSASAQLLWLLRELVKSGVLGADGVCMTFMKQIAGELSRPE